MFESQFYTLTRALWWTADFLRWTAGYSEEGCGTLGRDDLVRVLSEVVSLVPGASPADAAYLELMLDVAAAPGALAEAAGAEGKREMTWAQFSDFLLEVAETSVCAAKSGDGVNGIAPVRPAKRAHRALHAHLSSLPQSSLEPPHRRPHRKTFLFSPPADRRSCAAGATTSCAQRQPSRPPSPRPWEARSRRCLRASAPLTARR